MSCPQGPDNNQAKQQRTPIQREIKFRLAPKSLDVTGSIAADFNFCVDMRVVLQAP